MEPTPAPQPTPQPTPAIDATQSVPPAQDAPQKYQVGGFLKQFDMVEIGFMVLGAAAIFYAIYYYRKKAKEIPDISQAQTDQERRISNIELKLSGQ